MNKQGFTLVELLATIVVIALISGIGVISYSAFINQAEDKVYKTYEDTMKAEVEIYLLEHYDDIPLKGEVKRFLITDTNVNFEKFDNPEDKNDKCEASYVDVERYDKDNISLSYKVCLICNNYNKNGTKCRTYN